MVSSPGDSVNPMLGYSGPLISANELPELYQSICQAGSSREGFIPSESLREVPKPSTWEDSGHMENKADQEIAPSGTGAILDSNGLVESTYPPIRDNSAQTVRSWERGPHTDLLASDFQYQKLQGNEIRLLILHPGEGMDRLDFDLKHVRISSNKEHKYKAMSYAWGTKMVDIAHRNGGVVSLPDNLYRGLLRLRPCRTCNTPVMLWADSICINQNDWDERRQQVRLMRKIYQQSTKVIVWLGDKDSNAAQHVFHLTRSVFEKRAEELPRPESPSWRNLLDLFNQEWFRRLWCLQEIVLAGNAEVHWGPFVAPWEHLGFAASWICNTEYEVLHYWQRKIRYRHVFEKDEARHLGIYRASLMYSLHLKYRNSEPQSIPFFQLLDMTRQFETGDPRDKAFALIGIPTTEADPDAGDLFVDPDYTKTFAAVYTDLAKRFVEYSGSLRLLSAVQHPWQGYHGQIQTDTGHNLADLPSWVPNWTICESRTLVPSSPSECRPSRSASLNLRPPEMRITIQSDSTLMTTGLVFDEVDNVESMMRRGYSELLLYVLSKAYSSLVKKLGSDATWPTLGESFAWTITGGMDWHGNPLRIQDPQHRRTHLGDYHAFRNHLLTETEPVSRQKILSRLTGIDDVLPDVAENNVPEGGEVPDYRRFLEAVWHATSNRIFFITKKGYMGVGPRITEPGHRVAILHGADLPMILESVQDNGEEGSEEGIFKVVGESYVHGIMDGEISGAETSEIRTIKLV